MIVTLKQQSTEKRTSLRKNKEEDTEEILKQNRGVYIKNEVKKEYVHDAEKETQYRARRNARIA